jgi:hypothetical protein
VVDGGGERVEEPPEPVEVGGVEGGDAGPELEAGPVQAVGVAGGEDDACSLGAGEPGVSSPMPELPPMTRTICPSRSGSRCTGEELIEAAMVPPDVVVAHVGSSVPACSAVMYAAYESPLRFNGCIAPGRHPGGAPGSAGFRRPDRTCTLQIPAAMGR